MRDLVVLVADKNQEAAMRGLLGKRAPALGIRAPQADIFVHPQRDPGVWKDADAFLRSFCGTHKYALVILDREGSGQEDRPPDQLRQELKGRLERAGWSERCEVIVIDPELEVWVWSNSPHVPEALGVTQEQMNDILKPYRSADAMSTKPSRPKEAMEACLQQAKLPRSSSVYQELAEKVSLKGCVDPSFNQLRSTLQKWFPQDNLHRSAG